MSANENLTIVFTDIVNYTKLTAGQSRAEAQAMLRHHDDLLLPIVNAYHGRRVKTIGDAMLLTFRSPTDAVHCGMALQDALAEARQLNEHYAQLHIRVAINLGEVRAERDDVYGEPVNIAARVEGMTPPDEVYFTEAVYLAMNKAEVPSESVGEHELKGIPDRIGIYRVPRFQFSRLVASGPGDAMEAELPFAGAHLRREPVVRSNDRLRSRLRLWRVELSVQLQRLRAALQALPAPAQWPALLRQNPRRAAPLLALVLVPLSLSLIAIRFWQATSPAEPAVAVATADPPQPAATVATPDSSFRLRAGEAWENRDLDKLQALVDQRLAEKSDDADALLLRGHLGFASRNKAMAITDYATAARLDPPLADDPQLAANLVQALEAYRNQVMPLLLELGSDAIVDALALRSGQPGYSGRTLAISALTELGQAERIDRFNHALEELKGRSRCEDRRRAVELLRELKNPAALPALREARGSGLNNWWKNRCLRAVASETIAELEQLEAQTAPAETPASDQAPQRFSRGG